MAWIEMTVPNTAFFFIQLFRYIFFGTGYFHAGYYGVGWGNTMILFVLGIVLFNKVERTFMDTI